MEITATCSLSLLIGCYWRVIWEVLTSQTVSKSHVWKKAGIIMKDIKNGWRWGGGLRLKSGQTNARGSYQPVFSVSLGCFTDFKWKVSACLMVFICRQQHRPCKAGPVVSAPRRTLCHTYCKRWAANELEKVAGGQDLSINAGFIRLMWSLERRYLWLVTNPSDWNAHTVTGHDRTKNKLWRPPSRKNLNYSIEWGGLNQGSSPANTAISLPGGVWFVWGTVPQETCWRVPTSCWILGLRMLLSINVKLNSTMSPCPRFKFQMKLTAQYKQPKEESEYFQSE